MKRPKEIIFTGPRGPRGPSGTGIATAATFAALRQTSVDDAKPTTVTARAVQGDNGGGLFIWVAGSTVLDDDGVWIAPTVGPIGRWMRVFEGPPVAEWFGAKGDGSDDSVALGKARDFAKAYGYREIRLLSTGTYEAPTFINYGNVHFIGQGTVHLYAKPAIREPALSSFSFTDLDVVQHLPRLSTRSTVKISVAGDSTATNRPGYANVIEANDTLYTMLLDKITRDNPNKSFTFFNHSIGGAQLSTMLFGPGATVPPFIPPTEVADWYDVNLTWLENIAVFAPDVMFIVLGTNDTYFIKPSHFQVLRTLLASKLPNTDICFCSCLIPQADDPTNTWSTKLEQNGREIAAGFYRTWCDSQHYGLIDFNREQCVRERGFDPCISSSYLAISALATSLRWEAAAALECRDYAAEITFASVASTWLDTRLAFRLSGLQSRNGLTFLGQHNDFLLGKDSGTGNFTWQVRTMKDSDMSDAFMAALVVTTVPVPTSGNVTLRFSIKRGVADIALKTATYVWTTIFHGPVVRGGGVFQPSIGIDGDTLSPNCTISFFPRRTLTVSPGMVSDDTFGKYDLSQSDIEGGNGKNHTRTLGAAIIYGSLLSRTKFSGTGLALPTTVQIQHAPRAARIQLGEAPFNAQAPLHIRNLAGVAAESLTQGENATVQHATERYVNNGDLLSSNFIGRAYGGTLAAPAVVPTGQRAVGFQGQAYDGSAVITVGRVIMRVTQSTPGSGAMGAELFMDLNPIGSSTLTRALSLDHTNGLTLFSFPVIDANRHFRLRQYTVATLPSAATAAQMIYVSDGTANKRLAVSDGTNWRFPDGNIVS